MSNGYFDVRTSGITELQRNLANLHGELKLKGSERATRAGVALIRKRAKKLAPYETLKKSLVIKRVSKRGNPRVRFFLGHTTGPTAKHDGWFAHMVEFGTKPHDIGLKKGGGKKVMAHRGRSGYWHVEGTKVRHPGVKERPYMRPAFDENTGAAINAMARRLGKFIATGK